MHNSRKNSIMNPMNALPNFNNYQHFVNLLFSILSLKSPLIFHLAVLFVCFKNWSIYAL